VLREHPDAHTVRALSELTRLEAFTGAPEADALSAEALTLAEDLAVDDATLSELFTTRGLRLAMASRRPQAVAYFREAARLATQAGDTLSLGRALINLADAVTVTDPAAGAEAARAAAAHCRRAGAREYLAFAVINLAGALLMTGDWDGAEAELTQAIDGDGLADIEFLACYRAWLAALRGDTSGAQQALAGLPNLRASEDPQDQSVIAVAEGFIAAASRQPADALGFARAALAHSPALGISNECLRWAWPLATRAAHDLADDAAIAELLALLDDYQPGQLAPMIRAERDLVRARQVVAASDGDEGAAAALAAAVRSLSELSNPYHLAHGLLDYAEHLLRTGDEAAAVVAIDEARGIAQGLRCQPLLDRIEITANAESQPRIPVHLARRPVITGAARPPRTGSPGDGRLCHGRVLGAD
jgi:predicted negative regulator of RcsB-dependent stress response